MSGREKLLQLEKEGKYVFHGSPLADIKSLKPQQGTHNTIPDGNPAVSATPYAEFAIFRAIINRKNIPILLSSRFGFKDGKKEFLVSSKEVLDTAKDKKGFVYVFNKNEFEPYSRDGQIHKGLMEWRSYKEVRPVDIIEVNYSDLPSEDIIEITG
jgi:hypothetical protein